MHPGGHKTPRIASKKADQIGLHLADGKKRLTFRAIRSPMPTKPPKP
jgi:hypothetical protein